MFFIGYSLTCLKNYSDGYEIMSATFDDRVLQQEFKTLESNSKNIWKNKELRKWANNVVNTAKSLAAVKTGRMKRSISFRVERDGIIIFVGVDYAFFVEFGTINMSAQPFFNPAIEAHRTELERALEKALLKGIKI